MATKKVNHEVVIAVVRESCDTVRKCAPWVAIGWMFWCLVLIARAVAGQLTVTQIDVIAGVFGKLGSPGPAWVLSLVAIGYGYSQRRERLRKTTYLQERIIQLELKLDPNRSSSELQRDGSTRKEDRL